MAVFTPLAGAQQSTASPTSPSSRPPKADSETSSAHSTASKGFAFLPVASNQILNAATGNRHMPYTEILALFQGKLADALTAKGVGSAVAVPESAQCRIRLELLQALYSVTPGGMTSANLVLRVSVDGTDFSKLFQGDASRRKLAGSAKGWRDAVDKRLDEAAESMVKSIVKDQQFMRLVTPGLP
jgi:hypothetical protein